MYDLSGHLDGYTTVAPGTNLLVATRNADRSRDRVLDILGDGLASGDGAVIVTTDQSAKSILEQLAKRANFTSEHVTIVDCDGDGDPEGETEPFVYTVPSPSTLTSIGTGIVECFRWLSRSGIESCRVGVLSLSTMLEASDEAEIFKFSHVVSTRLDSSGFLGLFTIDPGRVDSHSYKVICEAFDETVDI